MSLLLPKLIFSNYLETGRTIIATYHVALLERLVDEFRKKQPHLKGKRVLLHVDNAPSHTTNI